MIILSMLKRGLYVNCKPGLSSERVSGSAFNKKWGQAFGLIRNVNYTQIIMRCHFHTGKKQLHQH
jgi:hypothetical protein